MRRTITALSTLVCAAGLLGIPESASAGTCTLGSCGTIVHHADAGHDPPILVRCDFGNPATNKYVYENESSRKYCRDTDQVYNRDGEEIWCVLFYISGVPQWGKEFDATGWYKINDLYNKSCTIQLD
jgi:hypothetical protein